MTFSEWMELVDKAVISECGLSYQEMGDIDWYGLYSSGVSPKRAAENFLELEGFYAFVNVAFSS